MDTPLPVGYNATMSAPHMHATELLDHLQLGMHALDVGSGFGYLTTSFAMMAGPESHAVRVEHIPELVAQSLDNIQRCATSELLDKGSLSIHVADGRIGWPKLPAYSIIYVGVASPETPKPLVDQLKAEGKVVIPIGTYLQNLEVVDKKLDGSMSVHIVTSARCVCLTS